MTDEELEGIAERAFLFVEDEVNRLGGDDEDTEKVLRFMATGDLELPPDWDEGVNE